MHPSKRLFVCAFVLAAGCSSANDTTTDDAASVDGTNDALSSPPVDAAHDVPSDVDAHDAARDTAPDTPPRPPTSANALVFMHGNKEYVPENDPAGCTVASIGPGWHSDLDGFYRNPVYALTDAMKVQRPLIDMPIGDGNCNYPWSTHPAVNPDVWKKPHVAMAGFSSGRDAIWEFFIDHKGAIPAQLDCVVMYDPCVDGDTWTLFTSGAAAAKEWLLGSSSRTFTMVEGGCYGADYTAVGNDFRAQFSGASNFHILDDRPTSPDHFATLSNHLDLQWTNGCPALADMPGP